MSPLPQRKKSPEELQQLRESLGIPAADPNAPATAPETTSSAPASAQSEPHTPAPQSELPEPAAAKPVRSLKKSEQAPIVLHEPAPDSPLPVHRHSDQELQELRRYGALDTMHPAPNPRLSKAHPALVVPAYLLLLACVGAIYFYQIPIAAAAVFPAIALFIAGLIFLKKPISRHHAAFIAVFTLFVLVYGALYYFPQLRHAT